MTTQLLLITSLLTLIAASQFTIDLRPVPKAFTSSSGNVSFFCSVTGGVDSIDWLLNGTEITNPRHSFVRCDAYSFSRLMLYDIEDSINGSLVSCKVTNMGQSYRSPRRSLLIVYGVPAMPDLTIALDNLTIILTVTSPAISDDSPNITYCVEAVNITSGHTLHSQCELTETEFTYSIPPRSECDSTLFTVTPVNVVGNGSSSQVPFFMTNSRPELSVTIVDERKIVLVMSTLVCWSTMTLVDADTEEKIKLGTNDLLIEKNNITISPSNLRTNRHYSVTVTAANVINSTTFETATSTHDIRNATLFFVNNMYFVETEYIEYSNARGAFLIIHWEDAMSGNANAIYIAFERRQNRHSIPFSLYGENMRMLVYDIESDGALVSGVGYPAVSTEIYKSATAEGSTFQPSYSLLESCKITSTGNLITTDCTYSHASGFQMIVHSIDDEMHKLYINRSTHSLASASVKVAKSGLHKVIVFPMNKLNGMSKSNAELVVNVDTSKGQGPPVVAIAVSVTIVVVLGVTILAVTVVIIHLKRRERPNNINNPVEVVAYNIANNEAAIED